MIKNLGVSFGFLVPSLEWISGLLLVLLAVWWWRSKNWTLLLIIVGGGLNWWERWQWGYVTDYWKIPGINVYNNFNDWLIFIGVVLYGWQLWKKKI